MLKLLGISSEGKTFRSFHAQSSHSSTEKLISECVGYENIVLMTDAGTPGISDPGCVFVDAFRKVYPDVTILPIPGPSALIAALSVSGFPASHFEFLGFIPHKKGKQTLLKSIVEKEHTVVFYESPHRIVDTLELMSSFIGERTTFIAREITKVFEECRWGTSDELCRYYKDTPSKCKGEFVVVVAPLRYRSQ